MSDFLTGLDCQEGALGCGPAEGGMAALEAAARVLQAQLEAGSPTSRQAAEQLWEEARSLAGQIEWGRSPGNEDWTALRCGEGISLASSSEGSTGSLILQGLSGFALGFHEGVCSCNRLPEEDHLVVVVGEQSYCLEADGRVLDESAMERAEEEAWEKADRQQETALREGAPATSTEELATIEPGPEALQELFSDLPQLLNLATSLWSVLPKKTIPEAEPASPLPPQDGPVCSKCSASNGPDAKFCCQCGEALEPSPRRCPKCSAVVAAGTRFCSQCGQRLPEEGVLTCGGCGQGLEPGQRFCPGCGTPAAT